MTVLAGLGNPEKEYKNTRHNIGFEVIDKISRDHKIAISRSKFRTRYGEGTIDGLKVALVKPQSYMNLSGECLRDVLKFFKLTPEDLIVIYDDADIAPGEIRVRERGSAGGHNGMKNVICHLGTEEFVRVRVGIGKSPGDAPLRDYVLGRISADGAEQLSEGVAKAAEAVRVILTDGSAAAMNRFNKKRETERSEDA